MSRTRNTMKLFHHIRDVCLIVISYIATSANGAALDDYVDYGVGMCAGKDPDGTPGKGYDYFYIYYLYDVTANTDEEKAAICATYCIPQPVDAQYHVGFIYQPAYGDCVCLYIDNKLPTTHPEGTWGTGTYGDGTATGAVDSIIDAQTGYRCYGKENFGVATSPSLTDINTYVSSLVFNDDCAVSFNSPTDIQLQCSFDSTEGATTKVEIRSGSCDENGGFNEEAQGDATTDATASASINIASVLTVADKNSGGPFVKEFCIRGDVLADDGSGLVSVGANKFDLDLSLIYETSGTFNVQGIQTSAFSAGGASASANRSDNLDTYQCNENGERDNTSLTIGDILYTCIESNDADVSVDITQLLILKNDGLDSPFDPPVTPINNSATSFVTVKNCAASTGPGKNKCIVSTLMIPLLYDGQTDSSIKVSGTASLTYSRRRLHANVDRDLQDGEESSFDFVVPLLKNSLPEVTNPEIDMEDSSSSIESAFGFVFALLGVVML